MFRIFFIKDHRNKPFDIYSQTRFHIFQIIQTVAQLMTVGPRERVKIEITVEIYRANFHPMNNSSIISGIAMKAS